MRSNRFHLVRSDLLQVLLVALILLAWPKWVMASQPDEMSRFAHISLPIVENNSTDSDYSAQFSVRTFFGEVHVSSAGDIYYALPDRQDQKGRTKCLVFRESLVGKLAKAVVRGEEKSIVPVHYFSAQKQKAGDSDPAVFASVTLGEVYEGIRMSLKATGNSVEKLFYLNPGADWHRIQVKVSGGQELSVGESGELLINTNDGPVTFSPPVAYQETEGARKFVKVSYNLIHGTDNVYGFSVGEYDPSLELVIDPVLVASYTGPTIVLNNEMPNTSIGIDSEGNVFVAGMTGSANFPLKTGSYDDSYNGGNQDVFVMKFDKDLKNILAATFLGGEENELCKAMLIDREGYVYLAGLTASSSFPVTSGAFQTKQQGVRKSFVVKLNNSLSRLEASSLFAEGAAFAITSSHDGGIYVGGVTQSGVPEVLADHAEIFEKKYRGGETDGFVAKFNQELSNLISMTLLGGTGWDVVMALATDVRDNVYVTGFTNSADFPVTKGSYNTTHSGTQPPDVFVAKLDERLTKLFAASFLGGKGIDQAFALAYDAMDNTLFVAGRTSSEDFPVFENSFNKKYNGGESDVFVVKFDDELKSLGASTFLGGKDTDQAFSLMLLPEQRIMILVGDTASKQFEGFAAVLPQEMSFPSTHAYAIIMNMNLAVPQMIFLGGNGEERVPVGVVGADKSILITGNTSSKTFLNTQEEGYRAALPIDLFQGFVLKTESIAR